MNPFHSTEFARTLFDESGDAMFLLDPDTDALIDANRTAVRLTGFSREELMRGGGTSLFRFERGGGSRPIDSATRKTTLFHARDGYSLRTKAEPGWRPVNLTVTRLHLKARTLALLTARDDADRRAALEALRRSEERFRALVEQSADAIAVIDTAGGFLYASPATERVIGYTWLELEHRNAFEFVKPDDRGFLRDNLSEVLARNGVGVPSRFGIRHKDGSWRTIDCVGTSRMDDPSVSGVVLNYRDVTDRVRAEERVTEQNALLRSLLETIPDVVVLKDAGLRFRSVNPALEKLAGRPAADLIGRTCLEIFPVGWAETIHEVELRVQQSGVADRVELWVDHADGRPRYLDCLVAPVAGIDGGAGRGIAVVGRDLTDRKLLEDGLREVQKMEAVGQLAGGVAHDFNNLLTVVLGNLEVAKAAAAATHDPALNDALRATHTAARRTADLTGQLLGFARKKPMRLVPVDLNQVVRETVAMLRRTIDPRVVIREHLRPNLWATHADPGQLNQVLMNLCLNARDAMPKGGTITLTTGNVTRDPDAARPGRFVRVRVRDDGHGMSDEVRGRIFEPFFTTKETGRGTGLGLAVVFGIAQAHGGWVECDSAEGVGTTFEVFLPMHEGAAVVARPTPQPVPSPLGGGESILLADDEPMIRSLGKTVLTKLGYDVTLAADGLEAVHAFRDAGGRFSAVILNLTMPNLSGREALARIRELDPRVPVILASGYTSDETPPTANGVRFLDKPYGPADLAKAVRAAVDAGKP